MAVYTEVSDDALEAFLREYAIGDAVSFKGIAEGVENSNYLLQTTQGTFILTLYEKRVRRDDLPYFLGLLDHLAARGIACPTPVHGRDGKALRSLEGRPAAIVRFLEGMCVRRITPGHCRELGAALAALHKAGNGFAGFRENDLSRAGWRRLFEAAGHRADEIAPGLGREIAAELDYLDATWPGDLPRGIIHADLFPDNVFFRGDKLSGLIDFYFACNDHLAYDLAVCLNAWCFETDNSFNVTKARYFLEAYDAGRALHPDEIAALPVLARGAALRFLLTRLYDWFTPKDGALVRPKDPVEYLKKLRFHARIKGPEAYGLAAAGAAGPAPEKTP